MNTDEWWLIRRPSFEYGVIMQTLIFFLVIFGVATAAAQPANNHFANATVISGVSGAIGGNNVGATIEPGEPAHAGNSGGASVWFRWTAPSNSLVSFNTMGSAFDTLLAVYRGSSLTNLQVVVENDDAVGTTSAVDFVAGAGMTFWIAVDGYAGAQGSFVLNWSASPGPLPPSNDAFGGAKVLVDGSAPVAGKTQLAGKEPGEPAHAGDPGGRSLWYLWTAPSNGVVTIETLQSNFDTLLAVYSGASLGSLTVIASNNNAGPGVLHSRVTFPANAGVAYRIAVDGRYDPEVGADGGTVVLDWYYGTVPPVRDLLPDLFVWADVDKAFMYGWYLDTNQIPGRTLLRVTTTVPNVGRGPAELRATGTGPEVYQRIYRSDGSFYDRLSGTFTYHPGHGHLHFDNFMQFQLRSTNGGLGDVIVSGDKTSFALIDFLKYDASLPGVPAAEQYFDGGLVQGISVGWADVYSAGLPDQWIDITGVPDGTYWLEATVDPDNNILESDPGNNTTRVLITLPPGPPPDPPANNNFANAEIIAGQSGSVVGENVNASKESGEPFHAGNPGGRSIWYRWTAPFSGTAIFDTRGSSFNTLLGIYVGSTLTNLVTIASDDDFDPPGKVFSRASFAAESGTTYWIAVDGANGVRGQVALAWALTPPGTEVRIAGVTRLEDGRLVLECLGEPGISYAVEGSTNLVQWLPRVTLPNPSGVFYFTNQPSAAREFFRLRQSE